MHYDVDLNDKAQSLGEIGDDETDLCLKIGGGLDVFINQSFSIGLEGNYTAGSEKVKAVEYFNLYLRCSLSFLI